MTHVRPGRPGEHDHLRERQPGPCSRASRRPSRASWDLPLGTRRFSEDLQRQHGLAARDAENLIRGYDRSPQLDSVLSIRVEEIGVGVERAAAFLATSRSASALRAVYVCGGGSRTPGIAEMLGSRLKITVEHANPLARLNIRDGAMESLTTDEVAPLLMLPIGLALRQ